MSDIGITREEAIDLLKENLRNENLIKHCLATEAIMRLLAKRLGEDEELWGIAGLLHDLDFEKTKDSPSEHTLIAERILRERGVTEEVISAIKSHNAEGLGLERAGRFEHLLAAAETITGLIVAAALVRPDKRLAGLKPKSIRKRMKEKAFARAVRREVIAECEEAGLGLDEFIGISLEAMQGISDKLGL